MNDEKALPPVLTMDAPERTLDVVTLEIQTLQRQAIEVNLRSEERRVGKECRL